MEEFTTASLTTYKEVDADGRVWTVNVLAPSYTEDDIKTSSLSAPVSRRGEREQAGLTGIKGTTRDFI